MTVTVGMGERVGVRVIVGVGVGVLVVVGVGVLVGVLVGLIVPVGVGEAKIRVIDLFSKWKS